MSHGGFTVFHIIPQTMLEAADLPLLLSAQFKRKVATGDLDFGFPRKQKDSLSHFVCLLLKKNRQVRYSVDFPGLSLFFQRFNREGYTVETSVYAN